MSHRRGAPWAPSDCGLSERLTSHSRFTFSSRVFSSREDYDNSALLLPQSPWPSPPRQVELAMTAYAEFVICDHTIEESFLDDKSAAFDIEQSHLRNAAALSRLLLILATATLYLVSTGTAVVSLRRRTWVDSHRQRGLSYLKLGWRYLKRALALGDQLLTQPWLEAAPDPAPLPSTRRQDYAPTRVLATFFSSA